MNLTEIHNILLKSKEVTEEDKKFLRAYFESHPMLFWEKMGEFVEKAAAARKGKGEYPYELLEEYFEILKEQEERKEEKNEN